MAGDECDAVVVGAGPNGLVAANALADAGWDVVLVEAQDEVGRRRPQRGGDRPGLRAPTCSARSTRSPPPARSSATSTSSSTGSVWRRAPDVLAHALPDGRAAVLRASAADTAAGLDGVRPRGRRRLAAAWCAAGTASATRCSTRSSPPSRRCARRAAPAAPAGASAGTLDFTRLALLSVRRLGEEEFGSEEARVLLSGNAMHSDVSPGQRGQRALRVAARDARPGRRLPRARGRRRECSPRRCAAGPSRSASAGALRSGRSPSVDVAGGRAVGVRLADGTVVRARHGVARRRPRPDALRRPRRRRGTCPAASLDDVRPLRVGRRDAQGQLGARRARSRGPPPVRAAPARCTSASTTTASSTSRPTCPWAGCRARPFVLLGQMTTSDPTRSPAGTESVVGLHAPAAPAGRATTARSTAQVERIEEAVEHVAPGFLAARRGPGTCRAPADLEAADANLSRGAINAGTAAPAPAARPAPDPGARPSRDPGARPLPRGCLRPPRRWGARCVRVERRRSSALRHRAPARRSAPGAGPHGLVPGAARPAVADPAPGASRHEPASHSR